MKSRDAVANVRGCVAVALRDIAFVRRCADFSNVYFLCVFNIKFIILNIIKTR